jgi:Ca-activated chloride channel family protein
MEKTMGLTLKNGKHIALKALSWEGTAQGLILTMKNRQTYRNETDSDIETVYTFPLAWNTVVSRFAVEIDGKTLVAKAMEKQKAEESYEDAITSGDTPVMLEYASDGLCTAEIGRIKPGETVVIEIETVKSLTWDNGTVRIAIPTVIAERYSADGTQGTLQPHQQTTTNILAEYPVSFHLTLTGVLAAGEIDVPQHTALIQKDGGTTTVDLKKAVANRDIVVTVSGIAPVNDGLIARDPITLGQWVGFYTFSPVIGNTVPRPLNLKILVDCSGSMTGPSIHLAKHALAALAENLAGDDTITLTRFGSGTAHTLKKPCRCTRHFLRLSYQSAIDAIEADMGGTEMENALTETIALGNGQTDTAPSDILMITDGEVWDTDAIIRAVKARNHRLFIIGVGVAPGETLLRRLAETTGGACELVLPTEDMDEAVSRMVSRMRLPQLTGIQAHWETTPLWHTPIPQNAYQGESLTLAAVFRTEPAPAATLSCLHGENLINIATSCRTVVDEGQLAKFAADKRVKTLKSGNDSAINLATAYGLIGPDTNLILVHERTADQKGQDIPNLQQIPQMAVDDVNDLDIPCLLRDSHVDRATVNAAVGGTGIGLFSKVRSCFSFDDAMPCKAGKTASANIELMEATTPTTTPLAIMEELAKANWQDIGALRDIMEKLPEEALDALAETGIDLANEVATALALLIHWLAPKVLDEIPETLLLTVTPRLEKLPQATRTAAFAALEDVFPNIGAENWD